MSLGTLSSDDDDAGENVRKTIVLISKTQAVHCVIIFGTFLCRPLQNNDAGEMTIIKVFWRTSTPDD